VPSTLTVTWTSPSTVAAQDPNNPGPNSILPDAGGFFVTNAFRTDRKDYSGVLFTLAPGATPGPLTVTASVNGTTVSASVTVMPGPTGDVANGKTLYNMILGCGSCHGATGDGSQAINDAGTTFQIEGMTYAFPAPPLNAASTQVAWGPIRPGVRRCSGCRSSPTVPRLNIIKTRTVAVACTFQTRRTC
jgi:hypothetical protein